MWNIWEKIKQLEAHVFVTAAILSAVFALLLLDLNKSYVVETTVLVLPRSEVAAVQLEKITNNVAAFPRMLNFYDRILADNPRLEDPFADNGATERQKLWQKRIKTSTTKFSRGSLVTLAVSAPSQSEAKILSDKSLQTLFALTSKYYNADKDLELRVANGPIAMTDVPLKGLWVSLGIAVGIFSALLLESSLLFLENLLARERGAQKAARAVQAKFKILQDSIFKPQIPEIKNIEEIYAEHDLEEKPADTAITQETAAPATSEFPSLEEIHRKKEEQIYPNFPEMPVRQVKKAAAPENLPIAFDEPQEETPGIGGAPGNLPIAEEAYGVQLPEIEVPKTETLAAKGEEEPTGEELKKRLNQLLRGDF